MESRRLHASKIPQRLWIPLLQKKRKAPKLSSNLKQRGAKVTSISISSFQNSIMEQTILNCRWYPKWKNPRYLRLQKHRRCRLYKPCKRSKALWILPRLILRSSSRAETENEIWSWYSNAFTWTSSLLQLFEWGMRRWLGHV